MATPEPSDETLSAFYGEAYRALSGHSYLNLGATLSNPLNHRSVAQVSLASAYCDFDANDTFLDVGAGEGTSFYAARAQLSSPKLVAIELSEGASEYYARNVGATVYPSLEGFATAGGRAKIVLMSHSLEHHRGSDLDKLFREIHDALSPDGVLLIEVPNIDLKDAPEKRFGDAPHLLFFTQPSLELLLKKHEFEVIFSRACGNLLSTPAAPEVETTMQRTKRRIINSVRSILPVFLMRAAKLGLQLLRPERVLSGVAGATYGAGRECLRVVARRKHHRPRYQPAESAGPLSRDSVG